MLHCFIPTGHCLYFVTSLTDSSLLGMVYMVSLHASLVDHYWAWFVLFHVMFHWFIITWHGLYCLTSCFTFSSLLGMFFCLNIRLSGSSLLVMACIVSLHASHVLFFLGMVFIVSLPPLVHHYLA
jgi:hypothetical protein